MKKSISIIILNYNGRKLLEENIPSILSNIDRDITSEIIIVDNHSTDDSVEYLRSSFPQIKVIALDKNYGFCIGLNEGAKASRHELLFFLNNDIAANPGFLSQLVKHFENANVFGVSPKVIRPTQGMINESLITGEFKGGIISPEFSISQKYNIPDRSFEVFSLCGAAMMVDKSKFLELGGLDRILAPFYYEETDLSYRALKRGFDIYYEPKSVVYHKHNQSIGKYLSKNKALWSYRKNQYLCTWKNINDPGYLLKHILQMVIPKILIPNIIEWKALFSAFLQLPEIIIRRHKQKKFYRLSDKEIFRKAMAQIKAIKTISTLKQ